MANVIRHKRGTSNPAAGDFSETAELLVNTSDGGLFTKTDGGSVVEIGGDVAFNDLTGKTSGTGDYSTNADIVSGRGSGGVALTINDGYGNANVTWNHQNGRPEQNGNAARIEVNTDASTNAQMHFELKSGVTANTATGLTGILTLSEGAVTAKKPLSVTGNITVSGTVDGRDVAADGTKLDGIESGATADQTASEILTAIKTVDGSGSGLDADTLDGQQGSYYAPIASPTFTGTPAVPTASAGTNTTQVATTAFVQTAVANVVDSAPAALDTLNELAAALGDDANFSTTVTNSIAEKLPKSGGTMTGDLVVTTGSSNGVFWGSSGPNITSVGYSHGDLTIQNIDQLRFGSSTDWNWNEWAGIAFNSSTEVLTIGGPAASEFTSNSSPPDITINFAGLSGTNGLTYEGSTIWHAGNDGSGSGLDADTVDGVHASSFFQANNALNATTGAFSGDVTMSGTGALKVANGTTAQRPTAATGQIRYNTTLGAIESYVQGAWQVIANTALDYGLITSASDTTFDYGALS